MNFFKYILLLMAFSSTLLLAGQSAEEKMHRIQDLLPEIIIKMNIDPAIPDDFVGMIDPNDRYRNWIYWGPENVLKEYFKDPNSLSVPIIRVKLSANVAQIGIDTFSDEHNYPSMKQRRLKWGNYPVRETIAEVQDCNVFMAHVGMNAEGGWTLMFNLVLPNNLLSKDAITLWNQLMEETKEIKSS